MVGWIICITAEKERKTLEWFFYELLRFLGLNNFKIKALRQLVVTRLFKEKSQECHITMCNYFCLKSTFIRANASCVPKICRFMLFLSTTSNVQNNPLLDNLTNHFNIHLNMIFHHQHLSNRLTQRMVIAMAKPKVKK